MSSLLKKFRHLPERIKNVLYDEDDAVSVSDTMTILEEKYHLDRWMLWPIEEAIIEVLSGDLDPSAFPMHISSKIDIESQRAIQIGKDAEEKVFTPLKGDLEEISQEKESRLHLNKESRGATDNTEKEADLADFGAKDMRPTQPPPLSAETPRTSEPRPLDESNDLLDRVDELKRGLAKESPQRETTRENHPTLNEPAPPQENHTGGENRTSSEPVLDMPEVKRGSHREIPLQDIPVPPSPAQIGDPSRTERNTQNSFERKIVGLYDEPGHETGGEDINSDNPSQSQ